MDLKLICDAHTALGLACKLLMGENMIPAPGNEVHAQMLKTLAELRERMHKD